MSTPHPWAEHFGTDPVDRAGRITAAVAAVLEFSAQVEDRPRSCRTPAELRATVAQVDVCPVEGVPVAEVLRSLGSQILAHSVLPTHPRTAAHLHPPTMIPSVAAEVAIASVNQSMDSWDQAPAATFLELELLTWLGTELGLGPASSGVMTAGGTASNLLALTLARSRAAAREGVDVLAHGLPEVARSWRILTSGHAHFSVERAAGLLGLGRGAVIPVSVDPTGAMDPDALDRELDALDREGAVPIAIVATAGTTDLGAIDPLGPISERAQAARCWFHVDAAVGGALVLSDRLRPRLSGIELADSVTIDFHKLWWQPISASALVVADPTSMDLLRVTSAYLDRGDEPEGMVNLVGRSLDTSRRFDAAKVVAGLRTVGRRQMGAMVEHLMSLASAAADEVCRIPGLELIATPTTVMCVLGSSGATSADLRHVQMDLLERGDAIIGRTEIGGTPALKLTFVNPMATEADARELVRSIARARVAGPAAERPQPPLSVICSQPADRRAGAHPASSTSHRTNQEETP